MINTRCGYWCMCIYALSVTVYVVTVRICFYINKRPAYKQAKLINTRRCSDGAYSNIHRNTVESVEHSE